LNALVLGPLITLTSRAQLDDVQRRHLTCIYGDRLDTVLSEGNVQSATFSEDGAPRYRLYTKPHGSGYLLPEHGNALLAHATQHHIEVWSPDQRALFTAIDDAIRARTPGVTEVTFPRADDPRWEEVAEMNDEERANAERARRMWWPFS
jgi:hypothetical protein